MTRALDIGRSATDVGRWRASGCRIIFAGNILRLALRDQRWAIHWNDQAAPPGEHPASKREKPRPWQVRGSRAEALPRFWPIVMLHR